MLRLTRLTILAALLCLLPASAGAWEYQPDWWNPDWTWYKDHYCPAPESEEAPVPEPATMLLFGAGMIAIAAVGRRRGGGEG